MKVYGFEELDASLELLPLAARRALDAAGLRLSRVAWGSLSLEQRKDLARRGAEPNVDVAEVQRIARAATPPPEVVPAVADPAPDRVPEAVRAAFVDCELSDAAWAALDALDRYALAKVAGKGRAERMRRAFDEIVGLSTLSTHLSADGSVRMVDVGQKPMSPRRAVAESFVQMGSDAFTRLASGSAGKGDVLATARLAGILAAKRTPELIPLCHGIQLTKVQVDIELEAATQVVRVAAVVETFDRTGVEMEALCAAAVGALTIYDMLKAYDRGMQIGPTRLVSKSGGRSGEFTR